MCPMSTQVDTGTQGYRRSISVISMPCPADTQGNANLQAALAGIPGNRHWLWRGGQRFTARLQQELRSACDELDIPRLGLHGFRNLFAEEYLVRARQRGLREPDARREVSRLLGHTRIDVTYTYVPKLGSGPDTLDRSD